MARAVSSFTLIAVKEPEKPDKPQKPESYELKLEGTIHLDGYNVQQGGATFYVEHRLGSDTDHTPAYFTVRFFTASFEAGAENPGSEVPAGVVTDTDGIPVVDTDGSYIVDGVATRAASLEDPVTELAFTYPADKYGYATDLKVEAYSDEARTKLIVEGKFPITRDNPFYKARGEAWKSNLVFRNGEFILYNDRVYMWDYPIAGNSSLDPEKDHSQNKQGDAWKEDGKTHWIPNDEYSMIATKILFSQFALLGGAVMVGQTNKNTGKYDYAKMFSQTGADGTTNYERFDYTKDLYVTGQKWNPKACIDWKTGKSWFSDTTISGTVTATGGKIGPFEISSSTLSSSGSSGGLKLWSDTIMFSSADGKRNVRLGTQTLPGSVGYQISLYIDDETNDSLIGYGAYIGVEGTSTTMKTALQLSARGSNDTALDILNGTINVHGRSTFSDMEDFGYTGFFHVQHAWDSKAGRFRNGQVFFKNGICVGFKYFD